MDVLIVSAIFALVMIGLSIRANARFRQERKLPMLSVVRTFGATRGVN